MFRTEYFISNRNLFSHTCRGSDPIARAGGFGVRGEPDLCFQDVALLLDLLEGKMPCLLIVEEMEGTEGLPSSLHPCHKVTSPS